MFFTSDMSLDAFIFCDSSYILSVVLLIYISSTTFRTLSLSLSQYLMHVGIEALPPLEMNSLYAYDTLATTCLGGNT